MEIKSHVIFLIIFTIKLLAETNLPTYEELCKYDTYCSNLKSSDGSFSQPKQNILKFVSLFSDTIKEKASKLGVDPRAVAGSILAENSLNVQVDDAVQDFLVLTKLAPKASILGKQFSIGMGQIHLDTALEVEDTLAAKLGRKKRSEDEIAQALLTPEGAIEYSAGIVSKAQECYKNNNIDVSNDPSILATLYNLGKACDKALIAKEKGLKPKPNYFGWFVGRNLNVISNSLNSKIENSEYEEPKGDEKNQYIGETLVYNGVPFCNKNGAGIVGQYNQAVTFQYPSVSGYVKGNFRVISKDVDCDLKSWDLVQDSSGRIGWLSDDELSKRAKISPNLLNKLSSTFFDCKIKDSCVENLRRKTGKDFITYNSETGLASIKYIGKNSNLASDPLLFSKGECLYNNNPFETKSSWGSGIGGQVVQSSNIKELNKNDVKKYLNNIESLKKSFQRTFSIKENEWKTHPLSWRITSLKTELQRCQAKQAKCKYNPDEIETFFKIDPYNSSLSDLIKVSNHFRNSYVTIYNENDGSNSSGSQNKNWNSLPNVEEVTKIFSKCEQAASTDEKLSQDISKVLVGLKNLFPKATVNLYQAKSIQWLCEKIIEKDSDKKIFSVQCKDCSVTIQTQGFYGHLPTKILENYIQEIKKEELLDTLKTEILNATQNLSGSIPSLQSTNSYYRNSSPTYDHEKACNYDPFKNKERIENILKDNCFTKVLTNDRYIVGSLREQSKAVPLKTADNDRFLIQIRRDCGTGHQFFNKTSSALGEK